MNYVHHNPVKHGYARKWHDWPWSSAPQFLKTFGLEKARHIWHAYPVRNYGKNWDR